MSHISSTLRRVHHTTLCHTHETDTRFVRKNQNTTKYKLLSTVHQNSIEQYQISTLYLTGAPGARCTDHFSIWSYQLQRGRPGIDGCGSWRVGARVHKTATIMVFDPFKTASRNRRNRSKTNFTTVISFGF